MRLLRLLTCASVLAIFCDALPVLADPIQKPAPTIRSVAPSDRTVATLPACTSQLEGFSFRVTDGVDQNDNTVGGGSNKHVATCQQGAYVSENTAVGAGDNLGANATRGDIEISAGNADLLEAQVRDELEGVLRLPQLQGTLPEAKADPLLARDSELPNAGTLGGVDPGTNLAADLEEEAHAAEHQHGGGDEIGTATAGPNAIPKAGAGGTLAPGFLPDATAGAKGAVQLAGDLAGTAAAPEIAADAVGAPEIATDGVGALEVATDAIGAPEIATDAVGAPEIAADAVGAPEIATDAVGAPEIAAGAVGDSEAAAILTRDTESPAAGDIAGSHSAGYQVNEARYTPGDLANYGGSDLGNVDDHLDYLAARVRFLFAALTSQYDVVVDGTAGIKWVGLTPESISNRAQLIQEALNPALDNDSAPNRWSVFVGGIFTVNWADYYDPGPIRFAIGIFGTVETPGAGGTGGFTGGGENGWPNPLTTKGHLNVTGSITTTTSGTTLTDTAQVFGGQAARYVEIVQSTAGTCDGNRRRISGSTATTLTVDLAFSGACTVQAYRIYSVPVINTRSINIEWDVYVTDNDSGQDEDGIFIMRGNGWFGGWDGNGANALAGSIHNLHETGTFIYNGTNEVATASWSAGRVPIMSASTVLDSNRTKLVWFDIGVRRSFRDLYASISCDTSSSVDDGYLVTAQTWGYQRDGFVRANNCGFGIKFLDNNVARFGPHYIAGVQQGISFGEVENDGFVPYSSCLTGNCAPVYTGGTAGQKLDYFIIESAYYGAIAAVDGGATIEGGFFETVVPPLWHDTIIGAGKCTSGDADKIGRFAAESSDCGAGGVATFHATATAPVTHISFIGQGSTAQTTHERYRGLIVGSGGNQAKGSVEFGPHFKIGLNAIPANSSLCTGAGTPWFCEGAGANDAVNIMGPAFPMTGTMPTVRVLLFNAPRLTIEPGTGVGTNTQALWPYSYYWTPNHRISRFACDACDANVNDALTRNGGWVPDGALSANTPANAHLITDGFNHNGQNTYSHVYVGDMICTPGSFAGWEAGGSVTFRPFLTNGTTTTLIGSSALVFTEGVDPPGVAKAISVNVNTSFFDSASGVTKIYRPYAIGVYVSGENDSADDNPLRAECSLDQHMLGNE